MRTLVLTTPHEHGPDVTHLKQLLHEHHWLRGPVDDQYDAYAAQAVWRAKHWLGYPEPDHVAGAVLVAFLTGRRKQTPQMLRLVRKRLQHKPPPGLTPGQKLLQFALTQVGVKESPPDSNDQKYGVWYGFNGVAWCAIFLSYCASHVGLRFRYSYVPDVVADARAGRNGLTLVHASHVQPGDPACFDWNGDGVADHIAVFGGWINQAKGVFWTVEGNTSPDAGGSQSNGGEVCKKTDRVLSEVQAFARIAA